MPRNEGSNEQFAMTRVRHLLRPGCSKHSPADLPVGTYRLVGAAWIGDVVDASASPPTKTGYVAVMSQGTRGAFDWPMIRSEQELRPVLPTRPDMRVEHLVFCNDEVGKRATSGLFHEPLS